MTPIEMIHFYFDCFRTKELDGLKNLLAQNLIYSSPFGTWTSRDAMLHDIWDNVTGDVYATKLEVFGDGHAYMARYRHNEPSKAHMAEFFRFEANRIAEIEVYMGKNETAA